MIKTISIILAIILTSLLHSCSSQKENNISPYYGFDITEKRMDNYLESKMEELNIPGLSIAIINHGKVVYKRTMGYANLEKKIAVTDQTIFEAASLSKSLFAFFVMKYVEEGKLDLDKPLYKYLPYPDISYDERYKKITARMVLSHRTGFPNWRTDEDDKKLRIKFEPDTDYGYSGEGYNYLAMVLKEIENTDWDGLEKVFQNKIAKPIGLKHTVFIRNSETKKHRAEPYDENGKWFYKDLNKFGAAGSLHTEPIDFSKWMIAVMNEELLHKESYKELFKPHSEVSKGIVDVYYSLGFFNPHFPLVDTEIYGHSGHNSGFRCWYMLDTEKDWGYVLFTNSDQAEPIGNELMGYLFVETYFLITIGLVLLILLIGVGYLIRIKIRKSKT